MYYTPLGKQVIDYLSKQEQYHVAQAQKKQKEKTRYQTNYNPFQQTYPQQQQIYKKDAVHDPFRHVQFKEVDALLSRYQMGGALGRLWMGDRRMQLAHDLMDAFEVYVHEVGHHMNPDNDEGTNRMVTGQKFINPTYHTN